MVIFISSDFTAIEQEIDRLSAQPSRKAVALLDAVLATGFATVHSTVHVQTGSLKSSLKQSSKGERSRSRWEGTIRAGGPSTGVNNPVDYAIYEKRRDGAHDFFSGLPGLHAAYITAIKKGMRS